MSNDNDGNEKTSQPEILFQLFDSLILSPFSLKVLKCFCATVKVFCEFSCVFRGVVPLSFDKIVGFFTNHSFF